METKKITLRSQTVKCPHCGEYYSVTYKYCPFCDAGRQEEERRLAEKKKKKQDETAEWRKKVRREFTDAAGNTEKAEQHKKFRDEYRERLQFEEPEETDYGETVVLSAGAVKGPSSLVSKEPGELATIFLERDLTIIGKMENAADAVIPRPTVSRVHARIRKDEEEYFLADLNSRNGTSVNGRMLRANEEYQLQDEDEVDFAEARYIFIK